ncbi:MAG TPA: hypothetical protein VF765_00690 [Polyangiaceae bacterium]
MRFAGFGCFAFGFIAIMAGACSSSSNGTSPGGGDAGADRVVEAGPGPGCQNSDCAAGNVCIDDGSGKGATCHLACTSQTQCPFGYYCNDADPVSWCVAATVTLTQGMGQWGTSCNPGDGESNNPACDNKSGFKCYALSPMDTNAFCTFIGCRGDTDCPGGWWCARVDSAPNSGTDNRSFGMTRNVCMPRTYCSPCETDHDCNAATSTPGTAGAATQHCVKDAHGTGLCTTGCSADSNCNLDATCKQFKQCEDKTCTKDADCGTYATGMGKAACVAGACRVTCESNADCAKAGGSATGSEVCDAASKTCRPSSCAGGTDGGTCIETCSANADCGFARTCTSLSACLPRAGECLGKGAFCDPCRSDADCASGAFCLNADYSTERYCSAPVMGTTCPTMGALPAGACPSSPMGSASAASGVSCTSSASNFAPANQCIPLDNLGGPCNASNPANCISGCWSVHPM